MKNFTAGQSQYISKYNIELFEPYKEITSQTPVLISFCGQEGYNSYNLYSLFNTEEFDQIVLKCALGADISSEATTTKTLNNLVFINEILSEIEEKNGVELKNVNTMGFSVGAEYSLKTYAHLCMEGRDKGICVTTSSWDMICKNTDFEVLTKEETEALKGKTIIVVEPERIVLDNGNYLYPEDFKYINYCVDNDINIVIAKANGDHLGISKNVVSNTSVTNVFNKNVESFYNSNYKFFKCIKNEDGSKNWVEIRDISELKSAIINQNKNILEKYNNDLSLFSKSDYYNDGTLASDLYIVYNNTEAIINNTSKNISVDANQYAGGIVGNMNALQNYYGGLSNSIKLCIGSEMKAIQNIASSIFKMDGIAEYIGNTELNKGLSKFLDTVDYDSVSVGTINSYIKDLSGSINDFLNKCEFLKDESFHTLNSDEKIGKTSVSDLDRLMYSTVNLFNYEQENNHNLKGLLDSFSTYFGNNSKLNGEIFTKISNNVNALSDTTLLLENSCKLLSDVYKIAIEMIREAILPEDSIDASELTELNARYTEIVKTLAELEKTRNSLVNEIISLSDDTSEEGSKAKSIKNSQLASLDATIESIKSQMEVLKEKIDRIENYKRVVIEAQHLINDAFNEINQSIGSVAYNLKEFGNARNPNIQNEIQLDFSHFDIQGYESYIDNYNMYYNAYNPPKSELIPLSN